MSVHHRSNDTFPTAETDFGLNLLRLAPANESLVVSPLSVIFSLIMIQAGAKGNTKIQINKLLSEDFNKENPLLFEKFRIDSSEATKMDYYSSLSQQISKATNGVKSSIANGFFVDKKYEIEKDYGDVIAKKLSAKIESHDFIEADETAEIINNFVSKATEGKITKFIEPESVQGALSVIINAVYFTAEWENKFNKWGNYKQKFYSSQDNIREIDFMHHGMVRRYYAEDRDLQVLSLRYKDISYTFNIFLPKKRYALEETLKTLDGTKVQQFLSKLEDTLVSIAIPKMNIETDFGLKKALLKMGATDMFSDEADFSGISKIPMLRITDARHKAIIEDGTTAAAATAMMLSGSALIREEPKEFTADHPFFFILAKDKDPLFMGYFV